MTEPVLAATRGASVAAVAAGAIVGGFGFLAAVAQGMATAPGRWSGLFPLALMVGGGALVLLGLASLAAPRLRPAAKKGAIAAVIGLAGLYVVGQLLIMTGFYDG